MRPLRLQCIRARHHGYQGSFTFVLCLTVIRAPVHSCVCCACASCFHHRHLQVAVQPPGLQRIRMQHHGYQGSLALTLCPTVIRAPVHSHVCLACIFASTAASLRAALVSRPPAHSRAASHFSGLPCASALSPGCLGSCSLVGLFGAWCAPSNTHLHVMVQALGLQRTCAQHPSGLLEACWVA